MTRLKAFPLLEGGPFRFGLIAALGVLVALALGSAVITLRYSLTLIFAALFISLGLYPLVRWLERWKLSRGGAVLAVAVGFLVVVVVLIRFIVPILVEEGAALVRVLPSSFDAVGDQEWFRDFNGSLGWRVDPAAGLAGNLGGGSERVARYWWRRGAGGLQRSQWCLCRGVRSSPDALLCGRP